jgi:hypothetical protein
MRVKWKCKSNVKEETLNSLLNAGACDRIYALGECAMREIIRCCERERESERQIKAHTGFPAYGCSAQKNRDCAMAKRAALFLFEITRDKILLSFYWATAAKHEKWPGKSRNRCCGELGLKAIKRWLLSSDFVNARTERAALQCIGIIDR